MLTELKKELLALSNLDFIEVGKEGE